MPEVAFAGRSNVGKSSLMNSLMSRHNLVRTSSTPGCTRQVNVFSATLTDGFGVNLVDLPGFGFARRSKQERDEWAALVENYLAGRRSLGAIVLVMDIRRGAEAEEKMLLDFVRDVRAASQPLAVAAVATKADKLGRSQALSAAGAAASSLGLKATAFSAVSHQGRDAVWQQIRKLLRA